jgi:OOP family OmpA-OmpF porin
LGARFFIAGLRDPLAADPAALLRQTPIDPADVESQWKPYHALEAAFVQARAARVLEPPATVKLKVENGVLAASGLAAQQWIENARQLARALPGITRFDESGLLTAEMQEQLQLKDEVEKSSLRFMQGTTQFAPGQEAALQSLAKQMARLFALAPHTGKQPRLTIVGHTDAEGGEAVNQRLSLERATRVLNAIAANGVARERLHATGVGNNDPLRAENTEEDRQLNRRVSFRLELP